MAGIFARLSTVFRSKANKALDKVEDPRETLDYSYQRQLDMLQKVRRGVADVATSRKRVELQMNQLQTDVDKMQNAASRALEQGREDLAREALTRKATLQAQLNDLQTQHATLQAEEEKLIRGSQRLQARVDAFRTKKETIKATYSAAEAQTRINEASQVLMRRWATSAWRSPAPRTRRWNCRLVLEPWTNSLPVVLLRIPLAATATTSPGSSTVWPTTMPSMLSCRL